MTRLDRIVAKPRRNRLFKLIPPRRCVAIGNAGNRCLLWAMVGATVCHKHGGKAPQIMRAAAERVTLAEALLNGDRRHPQEVLASAMHATDVLAQDLQAAIAGAAPRSPEMVERYLEATKTQAAMAKLNLDAAGAQSWSAQEAMRQQGEAVAAVCREMARQLGHDPGSPEVAAAFEAALNVVVRGKRRRPVKALAAIEEAK